MSYVADVHEARTIASDALMVLWEKCAREIDEDEMLPYLFCVVKNKALNFLRGKSREKTAMEGALQSRDIQMRISSLEACDPQALFRSDILQITGNVLNRLSEKTRSAFLMSRREGLTNKEIAARLGISEKAVEYHISVALRNLRAALRDYLL